MQQLSPETHRALEEEIERTLARALERSALKLPLQTSPALAHLMAKAAVTVYEAALELRSKPQ